MKLVQVRECDGKCCEEKPRWPNADGTHCRFWDKGCKLMRGEADVPAESPTWPGRSGEEVFQETCVGWPHNVREGRDTGGCCWQWIDDDD
jgi:hypothetical protein